MLAGYLKLVPAAVIARYRGRIINIHPALLPAFGGPGMYGRRVHEAVLASGARESGATVHLVDEVYDRGAILAQARVPVLPGDTPERLAARVLEVEHRLLPAVVLAAAAGGPSGPASRHRGVHVVIGSVMPRALISVSDKRGIVAFAQGLVGAGLGDHLHRRHRGGAPDRRACRSPPVDEVTGFPELLDGRVKTLHPAIHGALLARRDRPEHLAAAAASTASCPSIWWR